MECIGIFSPQNAPLNYYYQKKAGAKWSRTNKCWYMSCTQKNYELLAKALSGKAILDVGELKEYLFEKKKGKRRIDVIKENIAEEKPVTLKAPAIQSKPIQQLNQQRKLSKENNEALQKFRQQLVLKSYSPSTINTYTNEFVQFLQTIRDKPANEFNVQRIKDYLQYCFEKLKLSENTLHSRMNSLKFYYE